jgi:hypothetical protein
MIHLILFESFSNEEEIKKEILENYNLVEMIYDLIDLSMDKLDEYKLIGLDVLDTSVLFEILVEDSKNNLYSIFSGDFKRNEKKSLDDVIYWSSLKDIQEILRILKHKDSKIYLIFSLITIEDGEAKQLSVGDIFERMSELYPNIKIDIHDPWDLN